PSRPKSLRPCSGASGELDAPSGSPPEAEPVRSNATQWTKPEASGSSTISAGAAVRSGAPSHIRTGETSWPSQVNCRGIAPPGGKFGLLRVKLSSLGIGDSGDWAAGDCDAAAEQEVRA